MKRRCLLPLGLAAAIVCSGCGWFGRSRDIGPAPEIVVKEERPVDSPRVESEDAALTPMPAPAPSDAPR